MSGHCIAHGGKFYCYRSAEKSKRSSGGKKALPDFRECCKRASLLFFVGIIAIFIDNIAIHIDIIAILDLILRISMKYRQGRRGSSHKEKKDEEGVASHPVQITSP